MQCTAHSYEIKLNENTQINLHELHFKNGEKESMLFIVNKGLFFADKNCNGLGDDQNYLNSRPYYETSEKEYEKALNEILRNLIIHQIFQ